MSGREPRAPGRPSAGQRALLWLLIVLFAGGTGLFWAGQRQARAVDATVRLSVVAQLASDGTLEVVEEIVVLEPAGPLLRRVLVAPAGLRWRGIVDGAGAPVRHTTVPVVDGTQVAVPLDGGPTALRLRYDVLDAGTVGTDTGALVWTLLDDRNPLDIAGLELDLTWQGGEPVLVEVEAPGSAATAVPADGALRVAAGALPAHHLVDVHAALPPAALTGAMAQERSVLEEMGTAGGPAVPTGGGPPWLAGGVAAAYLLAWGVAHRAHGRDPEVAPPAGRRTERPGPETPAEVAWLLRHGVVREEDIAATVLDLHARGVVAVEEDRWCLLDGDAADVAAHERVLLRWAFAQGPVCTPADLAATAAADPASWRTAKRAFEDAVDEAGRRSGAVARTVEAESIVGAGVAAMAVVVAGVVGTALGQPAWLACVAAGAVGLVSMDTLARHTPLGAAVAAAWVAFGTHLRTDPDAAERHCAVGLVLGAPASRTDLAVAVMSAVEAVDQAYLGATSYLAAPRRRRRHPTPLRD